MTEKDKAKFASIMLGLAENFGTTLSKPGLAMRFMALQAYEISQVEVAALQLLSSRKTKGMPNVAEFLELLGNPGGEDKAQIEATKVLGAIKTVGGYSSVAFDDAVTQAVIAQYFGGWIKLCSELTADTEKWFIRDFVKAYGAFARQGLKQLGALPGIIEQGNVANGYKQKPDIKLIGNASVAAAIAAAKSETPAIAGDAAKMIEGVVVSKKVTTEVDDE